MQSDPDDETDIGTGASPFRIGEWEVFPDRHELRRGTLVRRVQPRLIALLVCLAKAGGRTVSREDMIQAVWSRRMVNDEVLSRAIADLRRALDEDARTPQWVETVPKLGYRLRVPAEPLEVQAALPPRTESAAPRAGQARTSLLSGFVLLTLALSLWWLWPKVEPPQAGARPLAPGDLVGARPLVSNAEFNQSPRFSRQGGLIAWSVYSADSDAARLMIRSRDGRMVREMPNEGQWDTCPLFSADGLALYWTRHDDDHCRLMQASLSGGPALELARCASGVRSCPDLSPAGDAIVFTAGADAASASPAGLVRLELASLRLSRLTDVQGPGVSDADPRFSPDGRQLAFLRGRSSSRAIMLAGADGGDPREIPVPSARIYGMTWMDPQTLGVATDSEGSRALVALDLSSGQRTVLGAPGARFPDRAPDGALVWEVAHYQSRLWWVDATGERELTSHRRSDGHPVLSPDGMRIAYQSNREGLDGIWLYDRATATDQKLPLPIEAGWAQPAWSPDGSQLIVTRYASGPTELWRVRPGHAAAEPVAGIPKGASHGRFAIDGEGIWFLRSDDGGTRHLWRLDAGTQTPARQMHDQAVASFRVHATGIFLQPADSTALLHCDHQVHSCEPIALALPRPMSGGWTVSGDAIYVQGAADDESVSVLRYRLGSASGFEPTGWRLPASQPEAMTVSTDGQAAALVRGQLEQLDLAWLPPKAADPEP